MLRPSRNVVRAAMRAATQPRHGMVGVGGGGGRGTLVVEASHHHRHLRPLAAATTITTASSSATARRLTTVAATATTASSSSSSSSPPTAPQKLPAFDYTALVASVCEIHDLAVPTKVELAVQADAYTLVLGLRGLEGKKALHVSWHPNAARVSLGPPPPRVHKTEQLSFGEQCHANLRGLILVSVSLPEPWERVATLSFAERPGAEPTFQMHCEIMGRNSNAVLVEANAPGKTGEPNIVSCAYQVGAAQTSVRPMSPGFGYSPPPPAPGIPPDSVTSAEEWRQTVTAATAMVAEARNAPSTKKYKNENARLKAEAKAAKAGEPGIEKGMVRAFRGVSPALASALALGAGVPPTATPDDGALLDDAAWSRLHGEWEAWIASCTAAVAAVNAGPAPPPHPGEKTPAAAALSHAGWCAAQGQLLMHAPAESVVGGGGRGGGGGGGTGGSSSEEEAEEDAEVGALYEPLSKASAAADPCDAGGPVGALFAAVYGGAGDADVFRRERDRQER